MIQIIKNDFRNNKGEQLNLRIIKKLIYNVLFQKKLALLAVLLSSSNAGILHGHQDLDHGSHYSAPLPSIAHSDQLSAHFSPISQVSAPLPPFSSGPSYGQQFSAPLPSISEHQLSAPALPASSYHDSGSLLAGSSFPTSGFPASLSGPALSLPAAHNGPLPGAGFASGHAHVGSDSPLSGVKSPVIDHIHHAANVHANVPVRYRVRDEPYQVFREQVHRVPQPVPVPVPQPVQVPVPQPYPVQVPVVRNVPVPVVKIQQVKVDKPVPYPVEKIVKIPIEKVVHVHVPHPVPVERIVEVPYVKHVKVPVQVVKTYPVPVVKTVHHKVRETIHHKGWHGHGYGHGW